MPLDKGKPIIDDKEYYRGMRIIVESDPIIIYGIGRQFIAGNKNTHNIVIKKFVNDYPVFSTDLNTNNLKVDADGYQYVAIPPLTLNAGESYIVASKEDSTDKFMPNNLKEKAEVTNGYRIAGNFMLSPTGDRKPVVNDQIGSILNFKYEIGKSKEPKNLALGAVTYLLNNSGKPLLAWQGRFYAENAVDGNMSTRAHAGGEYAWTLKIDLGKVNDKIKQTIIDFGTGTFPTEFQLLSSIDGSTWTKLAEKSNNSSLHIVFNFPPTRARYFEVKALKPDGPGQKGGAMGVLEFRAFK